MSNNNAPVSREPGHQAFEAILKTFGPSIFVIYFFTIGYLRNLKIPAAPSLNEALVFFISSILPTTLSDIYNHAFRLFILALPFFLSHWIAPITLIALTPPGLKILAQSKKIKKCNRLLALTGARYLNSFFKFANQWLWIWVPGLVVLICISELNISGSMQLFAAPENAEPIPMTRLTYVTAILAALIWGPLGLLLHRGKKHYLKTLNLIFSFAAMCALSYQLSFKHSGNFTSASSVRMKNNELTDHRIVWSTGSTNYFVSCPKYGEWVVIRYDGVNEIFRTNLSRAKHLGICREK